MELLGSTIFTDIKEIIVVASNNVNWLGFRSRILFNSHSHISYAHSVSNSCWKLKEYTYMCIIHCIGGSANVQSTQKWEVNNLFVQ